MIKAYLISTIWKNEEIKRHYEKVLSEYNPDYKSNEHFVIIQIKDIHDLIKLSKQCKDEIIISSIDNYKYDYIFDTEEKVKKEDELENIVVEIYDGLRE